MKSIGNLRLFLVMAVLYMLAAVNPGWAASVSLETKVNQYFQHNFSDDFASGPYSLESGTLPPGVVMNLSGIIDNPTQVGVYIFTVRGFDENGDDMTVTYTVTVKPLNEIVAHDAVVSLDGNTMGLYPYAYDFWQHVNSGDMAPDQIVIKSVSDSRATISPGSGIRPVYLYLPFAVRGDLVVQYAAVDILNGVESNIATITFNIARPEMALRFNESTPPASGKGYGVSFIAENGVGPFTYSYSGNIPAGLVWEEDHNGSGTEFPESAIFTLRGTLPNNGVYPITVTITDALGQSKSISHTIDLGVDVLPTVSDTTITMPYGGSVTIDLSTLITGDFDHIVVHSSGYGYTTVAGNNVTYTGPQKSDPYASNDSFTFSVFTSTGAEVQASVYINLDAATAPVAAPFAIQTSRNKPVEFDLNDHITAGYFDIDHAVITTWPGSGVLDALGNGRYRYTPETGVTGAETIQLQYEVSDTYQWSAPATITIEIAAEKLFQVVDGSLSGKVGQALEHEIAIIDGVAPFTFSIQSPLPAGISISGDKIVGVPTAEGYTISTIEVVDAVNMKATGTFTFTIVAADSVSLPALTLNGKVGESFSQSFAATGGTEPYTYELVDASALPDGLALAGNVISGIPTVDGTFIFELKATDANSATGIQSYTLTVVPTDAVVEAPKAENGSLDLDYGQSATVDLAQLITGDVDTIAIVSQPSKGSTKLEGNTVTYVPNEGATGSDNFSFLVSNAGGSATANIAISIKEPTGEAPIAKNHFIRLQPLQAGDVNLTEGAVSKDPITRVHVLTSISDEVGNTNLSDTHLGFQPNKAFAGNAVVSYQLENKWGRSAIATATFVVAERPDPSKDAEVAALLKAQVDAAIRLADDQVDNITRRLEQIRAEAPGARSNSFDWQLGVDSKDSARYDHDGNDISAQNSLNARGTFESSNPLAIWTTGYVRLGESELGGVDMKSTAVGGTAGVDYRFNENFVGGVAIGFGREMSEIGSNGTDNEAKAISGALYGTWHNRNGAFVDGIIGFSHLTMDSTRYVTSTGELAYGSRDGTTVFGSIIGGYRFETQKGLKIEPYVGFRGVVGKLNGFTERGDDWTNLAYGTTDIRSLKAVAGIRVEKQYETEDFLITPNAKVEYRHELASGTNTALGYADLGTMPYSVMTDPSETSSVVASVGVRVKPKASNLSVEASAQASMSGSGKPTMTYAVRANWEICGIGFKKTDCMTREQRVTFFKGELAKAEKKKDANKIAEFKKLLAKAEADLREWNALSAKLTPVPDMNTQFVDTISGKGKLKR
ncbi:autotransporter domain-containing protein [Brucella tritici]|uniref:Autotransporter domain-containing protein n=1 Tax=Brucella tritici TaxID=94626 RepID=A0A6L3Y9S7_9HYPH|nr:autotransporter domain-containing protein [Brucella tritici]KAB2680044.1 autotransporter domain-containing protein [Brucella tritici]